MPKYIIRDLYCLKCGTTADDQMVLGIAVPVLHPCAKCKQDTEHGDQGTNTGGKYKRYRFADFPTDPRAYRGQVRAHSPKATVGDIDGEDSVDGSGKAIHDRDKFQEDAREERRAEIYADTDRKRGHTPLVFDQAKKGEESHE